MKKLVLVLVAVAVFVWGCTSSTVINTVPPGAQVYIEGQLVLKQANSACLVDLWSGC